MLKLLERAIDSADERLVVLAPEASVPETFSNVEIDYRRHRNLVRAMQHMRGSIYLRDGAITRAQLTYDGLHQTPEDDRSWHLLTVNRDSEVTGCAWYLEHPDTVTPQDLRVRHTPLARGIDWRDRLWKAVEGEIGRAHRDHLNYVEVGGWAVSSARSTAGLVLALAGYSLGRLRGGCLGMTTATVRHCSSEILRRIGGSPLEVNGTSIPAYFDSRYQCEMEILRFDSRQPAERYSRLVERLCETLKDVLVVARGTSVPEDATVGTRMWAPAYVPVAARLAS
jgi:hypothetical protein